MDPPISCIDETVAGKYWACVNRDRFQLSGWFYVLLLVTDREIFQ